MTRSSGFNSPSIALRLSIVVGLTLLTLSAGNARSQGFTSSRVVSAEGFLSFDRIAPGSSFRLAVAATIDEAWHVNAHEPSLDYLIATTLEIDGEKTEGLTFSEPIYPAYKELAFSFTDGKTLRVYDGRILIGVEGTASRDVSPGQHAIPATLTVQACNDTSCLAPARIPVSITAVIAAPGEPIQAIHPEVFGAISFAGGAFPTQGSPTGETEGAGETENTVARWVAEGGWFVALPLIFLGGLALNLTPCVYPLIPITLAYFGGQARGRPGRTFGLASIYVLGMCATYSALGVLAATTGGMLGTVLQSPVVLAFVALVMVALGLSMLGLYDIEIPMALRNRITSKPGLGGALFMGLTVGLVAAPCVGPFVVSLLAYVGQTGSPLLGFWLFFVLALGLGLPYLFLGGFTGAATGLPKAGAWMVWVKKLFGCILFAMAFYFIDPLLPETIASYAIPVVLVLSGLYLGFVEGSPIRTIGFRLARFAAAAGCAGIAFILLLPAAEGGIGWEPYSGEALERATDSGRPVIIDFTADWCLPCKELDRFTFSDARVVRESERFTTLKADITSQTSDSVKALQSEYEILGAPTIVFIDGTGRERRDLRLTGYEPADRFHARMTKVD